jgi:hypothetical protein
MTDEIARRDKTGSADNRLQRASFVAAKPHDRRLAGRAVDPNVGNIACPFNQMRL